MKCSQCKRELDEFEKQWSIEHKYRICTKCAHLIAHNNSEPIGTLEENSVTQKEKE